ncbi:MAG: adenosylcobinamide-GDP ribazoletransferase [Candidatus Hydrothermarchaeaceae archaeon]
MIKGLKSVLGFLTIIPVGMYFNPRDVARHVWLFPVVGGFIALVAAVLYDLLGYILPAHIAAAFALFALLILTGFHHLDGLLDFGDGAMHVGNAESRRKVMHDVNTGAGGFALGFFVLIITYAALAETVSIYPGLIAAEASAKFSMVLGAFVGRAAHDGVGSTFARTVDARLFLLTLFVYLLFLAILPLGKGILVFVAVIVSSLSMTVISSRLFGGVSGDVLGAINEITRMTVLVVLLL